MPLTLDYPNQAYQDSLQDELRGFLVASPDGEIVAENYSKALLQLEDVYFNNLENDLKGFEFDDDMSFQRKPFPKVGTIRVRLSKPSPMKPRNISIEDMMDE